MFGNPEPVQRFLGGPALASLRAQLDRQQRLLSAVRQALPGFLRSHCVHCVSQGDRLLVYADSPAWATQLRFCGPSLLAHLETTTDCRFRDIRVRNRMQAYPVPKRGTEFVPPSRAVVELIRESAMHSPSVEVRQALDRLSRTVEALAPRRS